MTNTAAPNTDVPKAGDRAPGRPGRKPSSSADVQLQGGLDRHEVELLVQGRHHDPHSMLGRHGGLVRAFRPAASEMYLLVTGAGPDRVVLERVPMRQIHPAGLWEGDLDPSCGRLPARGGLWLRPGSPAFVFDDPYRLWPTLGDLDLHLFNEGRHHRLWEVLGAHPRTHEGVAGTAFAVWAPNAKAVRVVGDWNFWDGRLHPMRALGGSGVWELFIPGAHARVALQVRAGHSRRTAHSEGGPARFCHRGPSRARRR